MIEHSSIVNGYRKFIYFFGMVMFFLIVTGCKKSESKENNLDENEAAVQLEVEPTKTKEAMKLEQFEEIQKGNLIAEIMIKKYGTILVKLFPKEAPKAVENFTEHSRSGFYDGLTFYQIIDDYILQSGDPNNDGSGGQSIWTTPFENEISTVLGTYRGSLCMANAGENTNESQFFFVMPKAIKLQEMKDLLEEKYFGKMDFCEYIFNAYGVSMNSSMLERYLTYGGAPWLYGHHTVFGQVMEGFEILDEIAKDEMNGNQEQAPVIERIQVYSYK